MFYHILLQEGVGFKNKIGEGIGALVFVFPNAAFVFGSTLGIRCTQQVFFAIEIHIHIVCTGKELKV